MSFLLLLNVSFAIMLFWCFEFVHGVDFNPSLWVVCLEDQKPSVSLFYNLYLLFVDFCIGTHTTSQKCSFLFFVLLNFSDCSVPVPDWRDFDFFLNVCVMKTILELQPFSYREWWRVWLEEISEAWSRCFMQLWWERIKH